MRLSLSSLRTGSMLCLLLAGCSLQWSGQQETATPPSSAKSEASSSSAAETSVDDADWHPDPGFFSQESKGTYVHQQAGVRLHVPEGVEVNVQDRSREDSLVLSAYAVKVDELDQPLGYDKQNAEESRKALEKGEFGPDMDFLLPESKKVVSIDGGKTKGKIFMVLRRFEICDVTFSRILVFYRNGYQIQLSLQAQTELLEKQMPQYFTSDPANCIMAETHELFPLWSEQGQATFYQDVSTGKASASANAWFTTFDDIVRTIELF